MEDSEHFSKKQFEKARFTVKNDCKDSAMSKRHQDEREKDTIDSIATWTVAQLKEILKSLQFRSSKRELQEDRLRSEVQNMLNNDESFHETMQG